MSYNGIINDYNPPYFHAEYDGEKAFVGIIKRCVMSGELSSRKLKELDFNK